MEKVQYRSVIKFLFLDGNVFSSKNTDLENIEKLEVFYAHLSPSMITIRCWFNGFKRGRRSDYGGNGQMIQDIVSTDWRLKIKQIAEIEGIVFERVQNILHEDLGMIKLLVILMPRLLAVNNKWNRITFWSVFWTCLSAIGSIFFAISWLLAKHGLITTTQKLGDYTPKKAKMVPAAEKVMATVLIFNFLLNNSHRQGSIMLNYLADLTMHWGENGPIPPQQCVSKLVHRRRSDIGGIAVASALFSRFSSLCLLPVSKHDKMARQKGFPIERWCHRRNWNLIFLEGLKKLKYTVRPSVLIQKGKWIYFFLISCLT